MKEMMKILKKHQLTPNQAFWIWDISQPKKDETATEEMDIPDEDLLYLLKHEWIVPLDGSYAELSKKSYDLLNELGTCFKKKVIHKDLSLGKEFSENLDKYMELWPNIKLPSGLRARADKTNVKNNLIWFFRTYEYDWQTVLSATELYISEYEMKNYLYMRNSQYFVSKMNPQKFRESELANYCMRIKEGDVDEKNSHFSEKVV